MLVELLTDLLSAMFSMVFEILTILCIFLIGRILKLMNGFFFSAFSQPVTTIAAMKNLPLLKSLL